MDGMNIQLNGLEQLAQKLSKAVSQETLQAPLQRAIERLKARLQTYPPERPGESYQRTGNLGRGWMSSIGASSATLTNRVSYGPFVQGDLTQARMHQGRWLTTQQVADAEAPAIEADFQEAINSALQ